MHFVKVCTTNIFRAFACCPDSNQWAIHSLVPFGFVGPEEDSGWKEEAKMICFISKFSDAGLPVYLGHFVAWPGHRPVNMFSGSTEGAVCPILWPPCPVSTLSCRSCSRFPVGFQRTTFRVCTGQTRPAD